MTNEIIISLPQGYTIRPPRPEDALAVAALITATDEVFNGTLEIDANEVASGWERSGFDLRTDAWLATTVTPAGNEQIVNIPGSAHLGIMKILIEEKCCN